MNHILNQPTVLVLNRNWQAIHVKTPAEAFCMMASGAARALDMLGDEAINPVTWNEWLVLPVREQDRSVKTARGPVRVPTVIVAANFARVPLRRPRLSRRGIWERDGGRCQYTGRKLAAHEGNIDHVVPRSRGGKTSWDNCVLAHREVNSRKADKLPQEAGLRLLTQPHQPKALPATAVIRNVHEVSDWQVFLGQHCTRGPHPRHVCQSQQNDHFSTLLLNRSFAHDKKFINAGPCTSAWDSYLPAGGPYVRH